MNYDSSLIRASDSVIRSSGPVKSGYLYVFYNESFLKSYDENVYKLGRTKNLNNRISTYNTSFIKDSEYLITSRIFKDSIKAETVLFFLLRKNRIRDKREFFQINIEELKKVFERINNFSDTTIEYLYSRINSCLLSTELVERLDNPNLEEISEQEWNKKIEIDVNNLENFFDKFKYKK
jgi:hypothetical protein